MWSKGLASCTRQSCYRRVALRCGAPLRTGGMSHGRVTAASSSLIEQHAPSEGQQPPARAGKGGRSSLLGLYAELSKARLSALVVMTTSAGYMAAGGPVDWGTLTSVCAGTMLAAGSANTFNQVLEMKNDGQMKRTFMRPLPSGRISRRHALGWGLTSAAASCAILSTGTNELTALLGMGNLALYALPYTLSKTRTEANTWIGAVVGAVPPLMGWAAATNCSFEGLVSSPEAMMLASVLFLWQFPHFFALSWVHRKDYARGGFKMIPCNDPTGSRTADLILRYSAYLAPLPVLAAVTGVTGNMFAVEGAALNAYMFYLASKFHGARTDSNARAVFRCSLWYLPVLLAGSVFHSRNWAPVKATADLEANEDLPLLDRVRGTLSGLCVHEVIKSSQPQLKDGMGSVGGALCPPVVAKQGVDAVARVAEEAAIEGTIPLKVQSGK